MKKALRLVSLLLVAAMLALALIACGDEGQTNNGNNKTSGAADSNTSDNAEEKPDVPDGLDFGGYEVEFIVSGGDTDETEPGESGLATRSIYVDPDTADMGYNVNKAVAARNQTVEEKLNVKIVHKLGVGMQTLAKQLGPDLLAGTAEYDVVSGYQYFDLGMAIGDYAGKMLNYNTIDESEMYIDVTKPWWDYTTYQTLGYGGANYWITGDLSQAWVGTMFVSYVNTTLWKTYAETIEELTGYTDIYDVVEHGKWTMDLWIELGNRLWIDNNNNDTVDEEDQTAFVSHSDGINGSCADALAAGAHLVYTKWEDGVPSVDFVNDHTLAFSNSLVRLARESRAYIYDYDGEHTYQMHFTEGRTLICVGTLSMAEDFFADMDTDYYIVPAPKLNEQQDKYYTSLGDNVSHYAIPASCENVAATTATLELMGYYSWKDVTPEYYEVALKTRYVRGDVNKAAQMLDFIHDGIYSDFVWLYSDLCGDITWYFRNKFSDRRFSSNGKRQQTTSQKKLEVLLAELEDSTYMEG